MQQMVKCPNANCGAMVPESKAFCPNCGNPMQAEEQRSSGRAMDNMAATVVGFSLSQLKDGATQTLVMPKDSLPKPEPPKPAPPPVQTPVTPTTPVNTGGGSKTALIVVGGLVAVFILLAVAVAALIGLGFIKF